MQGLIGKKLGMTQVYDEKGRRVAVTVIQTGPCVVMQKKTTEHDGYEAVQLGFGDQKESRASKAIVGHCKKAGVAPKRHFMEFKADAGEQVKEGDSVTGAIFDGTSHVDISGVTKGQGFQGVVKRHNMRGGPLTHGGHSKRRIGSVGQNAFPARVAKGKRMPGHCGHVEVTVQNLKIVKYRPEDNVLLVGGAVPGPTGAIIVVRKSIKKGNA